MESGILKNQIIVITGGAGLLGKTFSRTVAAHCGIAVIADIDDATGKKAASEICSEFGHDSCRYLSLNITSKDSIKGLIQKLEKEYGRIDALVNNAYPRNRNYGRKFEDVEYDDFCENVNSHLGGYFLISQQMALYFKKQGHGNIVNIASIYGVIPPRFDVYAGTTMTMPVEYAVIKSALIHLTKYISRYFNGRNLRVNCISPGGILNKQNDAFVKKYNSYCLSKGMLDNDDLKGTLVYLLSDMSKYVNGQNIVIDDGFTL